jgi:NAD(P)-dependent dehydrogenase (short-subunit alcohol dehydrogenase family)
MTGLVAGKTILVTGGASGIGLATALLLAKEGANVVIADLQDEAGASALAEIIGTGAKAEYHHVDVTQYDQVKALVEGIVHRYGRLDGAFNNAGIEGPGAKISKMKLEDWDKVVAVDLTSVFICIKVEIEQMLQQKHGGAIVNTSSIAGLIALQGSSGYNASKHGVVGLTKTAAVEYATKNIRVNAVCPGFIETPMWERTTTGNDRHKDALKSMVAVGRVAGAVELAQASVWLLSDRSSYVTGVALPVDGGYTAG